MYITSQKCQLAHPPVWLVVEDCTNLEEGKEYLFISKQKLSIDSLKNGRKRLKIEDYHYIGSSESSGKIIFFQILNSCSRQAARVRETILIALGNTRGGLVIALVFGITQYLSWGTRQDFRVAGLQHMVAASGFNVSLVVDTFRPIVKYLPSQLLREIATLVAVWLYTYLAGSAAALLRATVMFSMNLIVLRVWKRPNLPLYRLGTAGAFLLSWNALYWDDISFQLSFAAVGSMMLFSEMFSDWLGVTGKHFFGWWPATGLMKKCGSYIHETLATTCAAQVLTLPIILFHFGEISSLSLFANVSILWLISPLTIASFVYVIAVWLHVPFVELLQTGVSYGIGILLFVVGWWGDWKTSLFTIQPWTFWQTCVVEVVAITIAWWWQYRSRRSELFEKIEAKSETVL